MTRNYLTRGQLLAALADAPKGDDNRVSYPSLCRQLKANGASVAGLELELTDLEADGLVERQLPSGEPWPDRTEILDEYEEIGPLYIRLNGVAA